MTVTAQPGPAMVEFWPLVECAPGEPAVPPAPTVPVIVAGACTASVLSHRPPAPPPAPPFPAVSGGRTGSPPAPPPATSRMRMLNGCGPGGGVGVGGGSGGVPPAFAGKPSRPIDRPGRNAHTSG